jgi:hypothetical protein
MHGVDMTYSYILGKEKDAINHLTVVEKITETLKIEDSFDFRIIKNLISHSGNLDSLITLTTLNLVNTHDYLSKKAEPTLGILILTGAWLESLYLICEAAKEQPNDLFDNHIVEQKIILDQLLLLLSFYEDDKKIRAFIEKFEGLQKIYDAIKTYWDEDYQPKIPEGVVCGLPDYSYLLKTWQNSK